MLAKFLNLPASALLEATAEPLPAKRRIVRMTILPDGRSQPQS